MKISLARLSNGLSLRRIAPALLLTFFCGLATAQAQPYSTDYVSVMTNTPGLLGYWRFDGAAPKNSLVNGWTGTNENSASIGAQGSGCPLVSDPTNQALKLPAGGNGYLATGLYGHISNQFTIMAWINIASYPGGANNGYYEIVDEQWNGSDCDLIVFPSGQIYFYTDAGGGDEVNTTNSIPLNQWHFVVGTMTNYGPRRIYLDGQLANQNNAGFHTLENTPFWIGYSPVFTPRHFVGAIDEAAIFSRMLTPSEVSAIYLASGPNIGALQSVSLSLQGVTQIPPQAKLPSTVTAAFATGSNYDVTYQSTYTSSASNVVSVDSKGMLTTGQLGTATIVATYGGLSSTQMLTVITAPQAMTHRYSFWNGTANDTIGTANGTLHGTAVIETDPYTGTDVLALDGSASCDMTIPAGTIDSTYFGLTVETWAIIQQTPNGKENDICAFGNPSGNTESFVRLGAHNGSGAGNAWMGSESLGSEAFAWKPGPMTGAVHVVAVWNPLAGTMDFYENGVPVNGNTDMTYLTYLNGTNDVANVIGAYLTGANGLVGAMQEFRIYNGPLSLDQIRISLAAGMSNAPLSSSNTITAGPITNVTVSVYPNFIVGNFQDPVVMASSASVQNINLTAVPAVSFVSGNTSILMVTTNNQVQAVGVGTTTLTATYNGVSGQVTVTTVAPQPLLLTHQYSFVSDASDSVGGENGTLMGNATASSGLVLGVNSSATEYGDYCMFPRDLIDGYPSMTLETWVTLGTEGTFSRLLSAGSWSYGGGVDASGILLSPAYPGPELMEDNNPGGNLGGYINDFLEVEADQASSSVKIQNAGLVQLVAVWDGFNHKEDLYYNGTQVGTMNAANVLTENDYEQIFIGKSLHVNDPFIVGTINECRFFYGAMTPGQVAADYSAVTNAGNNTAVVGVNQGAAQITDQPVPLTVYGGQPATFTVGATGAPPLSYQWFAGATAIAGATSPSYTIPSVTYGNAGRYSAQVSNTLSAGSPAVSMAASLVVVSSGLLTNGLVLHLPFDGDLNDVTGNGNDGVGQGEGPTYVTPGKVGSAAVHVSTAGSIITYVSLPTSTNFPVGPAASFSVAFWQRHTGLPNDLPMIGTAINSTYQKGWTLSDDYGEQELTMVDTTGNSIIEDPLGAPAVNDGQWHHVVMSVDRSAGVVSTYVDGALVGSASLTAVNFGSLTNNAITIGQDPTGSYGVNGEYDIDDLGYWSRALSASEAQTICQLGQAGVTFDSVQPVGLTIRWNGSAAVLNWGAGVLQSAPTVAGPWTTVTNATVPSYLFRPAPEGTNVFFRVLVNGDGVVQ